MEFPSKPTSHRRSASHQFLICKLKGSTFSTRVFPQKKLGPPICRQWVHCPQWRTDKEETGRPLCVPVFLSSYGWQFLRGDLPTVCWLTVKLARVMEQEGGRDVFNNVYLSSQSLNS